MNQPGPTKDIDIFSKVWNATSVLAPPPSEEFAFLPLDNLIPGQAVPFEVFIRARVANADQYQFQSCCPPGQTFEASWLTRLQARGLDRFYFRHQDQELVVQYLDRHLAHLLNDQAVPVRNKAARLTDLTQLWTQQFFNHVQFQDKQELQRGLSYVEHLNGLIHQDHYYRTWALDLCRHQQSLYNHSLNASLLVIAFGRHLGWPKAKICEAAKGALLHDIGMTRISPAILTKKGPLTAAERELIQKHPHSGFLLLKTFAVLSRDALLMVAQHHENGDGSGYPEGLPLARIHLWARMLRIIDSFEALISPRSWRPGYSTPEALWIIRQEWQDSGFFDAALLVEFIKFIGAEGS